MKVLSLLLLLLYSSATVPAAAAQVQAPAGVPGQAQRPPTSPGAPDDAQSAQPPAVEQQEIPKATLRGHVYARATGAPLKRALLTLGGGPHPGNPLRATTDGQGAYEFRNVEPGNHFTLYCSRNGYFDASYGQTQVTESYLRFSLRPGQKLKDLDFHLIRGGVISGRVLDEDGEPLSGVLVRAMARKYWQGEVHLRSWRQDSSDDRGEYRIFVVPPGRYYVKAVWQGSRYSDLAPVFYPNSLRAQDAQRIPVSEGSEMSGVDIRMEMVPTLSVSGKVVDLVTGRPVQGSVQVRPDDVTMPEFNSGLRKSDGSFRVRGLVPGRHYLIVHVARSRNSGKRSPLVKPFDLRDANIENMEVRVGPGVTVHGKIVAKGGEVSFHGLRVMLTSKASSYALRVRGYMSQVNEDLTFEMRNVQPGQYNVNVSSLKAMFTPLGNRWFYVGEVRAGGKNLVELGLTVNENAPVPALEIVLDFTGGTVTGLLRDEDEKPTSSVDVAMLSTDPEKRASGRYFRRGVPDQDGQFKISAIIPGDCLLLPWPESDLAPPFQDPGLFA